MVSIGPPFSDEPYFDLPSGKGRLVLREHDGCAFLDDDDPIAEAKRVKHACPATAGEAVTEAYNSIAIHDGIGREAIGRVNNEIKKDSRNVGTYDDP